MVLETGTVEIPNEIAQNLRAADGGLSARYDASARNLVAQRPILAYILKSALDEYKDYTVQVIAEEFIEGNPQVKEIAVHQDHPGRQTPESPGSEEKTVDSAGKDRTRLEKASGADARTGCMMSGDDRIGGFPTEDRSQLEGTIYYDIRFQAIIPQGGELAEVFVNIEVQNDDIPGYPIPKRGIYYGARMISSQRGTVFKDQEYGKVKRVVSIWVCEDTAQYRSDCINRYSFTEECIRGDHHETREAYDLITVVVLRLGAKGEKSGDDAIRLLSKLFSVERTYGEKIAALSDEFKISVTKEMGREVLNVCNLSTGVYNKGYDSGILTGRQEGFLEALFGLVKDGILSVTDAAERAGMKDTDFEKAYKMFLL